MEDKTMKKSVFGIAALLLALAACNKVETDITPAGQSSAEGITITATLAPKTADTKAVSEGTNKIEVSWAENEKMAILYEVSGNKYVADAEIKSVDAGGSATIEFTVVDGTPDNTPCTLVYPLAAAKDDHTGVKDAVTLLAAQDGTLSANLDVRVGAGTIQTTTPGLDVATQPAAQYSIFKFTVRGADGTTAISARPLTITVGTQDYVITPAAATDVLYAALPAVSDEKVSFDATDGSDRTYTCAKLSASFEAGKYYQSTLKMREYVDLGTVVGGKKIKWATCNVGAANPQDYGDYFAWGATMPYYKAGHSQDSPCNDWIDGKDGYNWKSYPFMEDGQSSWKRITKYTFADGQTDGTRWYDGTTFKGDNGDGVEHRDFASYGYADDAARANWGGKWRTPTDAEWTWLRNNCTWTWTGDYLGDGSNKAGRIVTSNVNGNVIFLPAAGFRGYANLYEAGFGGYYWSSSLGEYSSDDARRVRFYDTSVYRDYGNRYYGHSVRPVTE